MILRARIQSAFLFHRRLLISILAGICLPPFLPHQWGAFPRWILGWDVAITLFLALVWRMMLRSDEQALRRRADAEDESRGMILVFCAVAAIISLCALPGLLAAGANLPPTEKSLHTLLGIYTIICSWFFLQTIFTAHYAHEYYDSATAEGGAATSRSKSKSDDRGGLDFAGKEKFYHYTDFAYFSFTVGMTAQTSDTCVTTVRMRRLVLTHSIITFFFNTGIVALTINLVAGMLTTQ